MPIVATVAQISATAELLLHFLKIVPGMTLHSHTGITLIVFPYIFGFYSAPQRSHCKRCISYGNSVRPSVRLSVCLSVRHTPVLCQNDGT